MQIFITRQSVGESLATIFLSDSSILILKELSDKIEARNCLMLAKFQVRLTPSSYWLLYFVLVSKFLLPVPGSLQVLSPDFCNFIVCEWVCQLTWDQILRHNFSTRHLFISALEFFAFEQYISCHFFLKKWCVDEMNFHIDSACLPEYMLSFSDFQKWTP